MRWAILAVVIGLAGCGKVADEKGTKGGDHVPKAEPAEKKVYSRDEFRALIMGKSQDEVIKAVGKPEMTQDLSGDVYWNFSNVTRDSVTGEVDGNVQVVFEKGRVVRVNY